MITKNFIKALQDVGFTYSEDPKSAKSHCYAVYGGYLVSVYEEGSKKIAFFSFKFSENDENAVKRYDMSEQFSALLEEFSVSEYEIGEEGMEVCSNGNIATFIRLLDKCVDMLIAHEIRGAEYCSVCGNKFGTRLPKKVTYGNNEHLMCEHCAVEALEEHNSVKPEENNSKGNVFKGVVGSVIFSAAGCALFVILYSFLQSSLSAKGTDIRYILCVCGALIAFLAYTGYRVFCRKVSAAAYVTVAVNSLIFTAIGQYLGSVFELVKSSGYAFSALSKKAFWLVHLRNTIPEDLVDSTAFVNHSAEFYKLLAISIMFALVAGAIMLLTLRDKSIIKKEPLKIETIKIK